MRTKLIMAAILSALICVGCGLVPVSKDVKQAANYLLICVIPLFAIEFMFSKHLNNRIASKYMNTLLADPRNIKLDARLRFFSKCSNERKHAIERLEKIERVVLLSGAGVIALLIITKFPIPLMKLMYVRKGTLFFFPTPFYIFAVPSYIFLCWMMTLYISKRVVMRYAGDYSDLWLEYKSWMQPYVWDPALHILIKVSLIAFALFVFGSFTGSYVRITEDGMIFSERAGFDERFYGWDSIEKVETESDVSVAPKYRGITISINHRVFFTDGTEWIFPNSEDLDFTGLSPTIDSAVNYVTRHVKSKK